jgi:carbon-monoxide dehydrogenase medium subunit
LILEPFEYFAPASLEEACRLLYEREDAKLLAGGQSLLPIMKLNLAEVSCIVDLKKIQGLSYVRLEKSASTSSSISGEQQELVIGALTTHSEIATSQVVRRNSPLLADTAGSIGHPLVRNRGTIGGSLCHCDPAADFCVTALALDAKVVLVKGDKTRRVLNCDDFFEGTFSTKLAKGEILESVKFGIQSNPIGYAFEKLTFGHGDFPLVVVSVTLNMEQDNNFCRDARIAIGGVADRAIRIYKAEQSLVGKESLGNEELNLAADVAQQESKPADDLDFSADYKRKMVRVLVSRALRRALVRKQDGV